MSTLLESPAILTAVVALEVSARLAHIAANIRPGFRGMLAGNIAADLERAGLPLSDENILAELARYESRIPGAFIQRGRR